MFKFAAVLLTVTVALGTVGAADANKAAASQTFSASSGIQVGSGDQADVSDQTL